MIAYSTPSCNNTGDGNVNVVAAVVLTALGLSVTSENGITT